MKHDMTHAWHNLRLPPRSNVISGNSNSNVNVNSNSNAGTTSSSASTTGSKIDTYHEFYTLGPLLPDSSYEAKVTAKNVFGWSESSTIFQFYTQGKGNW